MKGLGVSGRLISGRDFRYEKISRAMRALASINIICPTISEILPTPLQLAVYAHVHILPDHVTLSIG